MDVTTSNARNRLLDAAGRLFYAEGIHAVGVDRVIAEADVAKATLYAHFAAKEELVAAYLARQSQRWVDAVQARAKSFEVESVAAALSPFDILAERVAAPGYRGCPFINAAAEFPGPGSVTKEISVHRRRVRAMFSNLRAEAEGDGALTSALVVVYDGAMSAAYLDRSPDIVSYARRVAEQLLHDGLQNTSVTS